MKQTTVTRRFEFEAAHRLYQYEGRCAAGHGHHYIVEVSVSAESLDQQGMVIDFGTLSTTIGKWIDENWDHAFLYHPADTPALLFAGQFGNRGFRMPESRPNPTAENMAQLLLDVTADLLRTVRVKVESVRIWETPDSYAEVKCGV